MKYFFPVGIDSSKSKRSRRNEADHDPLVSHIFVSRRDYRKAHDTKGGRCRDTAALRSWPELYDPVTGALELQNMSTGANIGNLDHVLIGGITITGNDASSLAPAPDLPRRSCEALSRR